MTHSPQVARAGQASSTSMIGSAKRSRWPRLSRSRCNANKRGDSGSTSRRASSCTRSSRDKPSRRRRQRSFPPITAASTRSSSHFQGARTEPTGGGGVSESAVESEARAAAPSRPLQEVSAAGGGVGSSAAPSQSVSWTVSVRALAVETPLALKFPGAVPTPSSSASGAAQLSGLGAGGAPLASRSGTCEKDRYSEKRRAERRSQRQASKARKARPAGSGRCVPRANQLGTPARRNALSRNVEYTSGVRNTTAMSSKGTPRAASATT